ncbi:MAG: lipoyl synthase [Nitrospinae bacterium]|nr:lipoyl synthase [Nitrospinota bacterium]
MKKPEWLRKSAVRGEAALAVRGLLRESSLSTVCEEARCPNMGECFANRVATFMILGAKCTRDCGFCAVAPDGRPAAPDPDEPARVTVAAKELGLSHVVITSVTRDDLKDGGAGHFAMTIYALRAGLPGVSVEVLTPDFRGDHTSIDLVMDAGPDVYNHNVETVPALYKAVRPAASYERSLKLLDRVKERRPAIVTKSGIMLGLGETMEQVLAVMDDLAAIGLDALTIGQYLRPSLNCLPVVEYVRPEVFDELKSAAQAKGIRSVFSGSYVRSSYHAAEVFAGRI